MSLLERYVSNEIDSVFDSIADDNISVRNKEDVFVFH